MGMFCYSITIPYSCVFTISLSVVARPPLVGSLMNLILAQELIIPLIRLERGAQSLFIGGLKPSGSLSEITASPWSPIVPLIIILLLISSDARQFSVVFITYFCIVYDYVQYQKGGEFK